MKHTKKMLIKALAKELNCSMFVAESELLADKWIKIQLVVAAKMYNEGASNLSDIGAYTLAAKKAVETLKRNPGESDDQIFLRWTQFAGNEYVNMEPCNCPKCVKARAENPSNVIPIH